MPPLITILAWFSGFVASVAIVNLLAWSRRDREQLQRLKISLAESEARLRDLFEKSTDAIFIHERETGAIVDVNRTTTELYGYTSEECRQLSFADLTGSGFDKAQERALACMVEAEACGEVTFFWQAKHKDGNEFPVEVTMKATELCGEKRIVANVRDITERVATTSALQQEQTLVSTLLDSLPGTFYLYDRELRLRRWNRNLEVLMGYRPEQLRELHFKDCFSPGAQCDELVASLHNLLVSGIENATRETRVVRADGVEVPYLVTAARLDTHEGPMLLSVGLDISSLVDAQTALRESELRYRALYDGAGDAILLLLQDRFVDCNAQALRTFGCETVEQLIGRSLGELSPPMQPDGTASDQAAIAHIAAAIDENAQRFEWLHHRMDESPFLADVSLKAVELRGVKHFLAIVRDVTEKKRLEERLRQVQRLESIGHLAGGIAHDFNNLLTPILGNVELLLSGMAEDAEERPDLEEVHAAAGRARRLTRQLLSFGRRAVLEVTVLDLGALVLGMERLLRGLLREDIQLSLRTDEADIQIKADPSQMEQVLMNLVVNARDAMPKGGLVAISVERKRIDGDSCIGPGDCASGDYAVLSVADTGHGMSEEVKARLFEPFFTTKAVGQGTGLGLATVFGIVQQHRGTLAVYSEPGKGSTFRVYLPLDPSVVANVTPLVEVAAQGGEERILVVEDDAAVRLLTCNVLRRNGYAVFEASNPEQAIAICQDMDPSPQVLVSDVVMPGMSGPELFDKLQATDPALRVLYMSGYSGDIISRQGMLEPGLSLLQKPFSVEELLTKLRQVIGAS